MGMAVSIPLYTVEELGRFPHDGNRYELLDGVLIVTPAPSQLHQIIAARLIARLTTEIGRVPAVRVVGPGVVSFPPRTQLEPDVLVYPARFPANSPWAKITEHWLAVEVFSPSSKIYDREFKRGAYLTLGVREVWLVDADERTIEVSRVDGGVVLHRGRVTWAIPETDRNVVVELADLFEGIE
jgi:Uma2 family endonuclease